MFTRTVLMAAVLVAAPALAAERSFPVGSFDRLAASNRADIRVSTGKTASVRAGGNEAAIEKLDVRVEDGILKIGTRKGMNWSWGNDPLAIVVTVPMLREVRLSGSGNVVVDVVKVPGFKAGVTGSGNLQLPSVTAETSAFSVSGSGQVMAAGSSTAVSASVAGSGDLDIGALKARTADISVAGSGNVTSFASTSAVISVAGSGDVMVRGGARCSVSKRGSGTVDCGDVSVR